MRWYFYDPDDSAEAALHDEKVQAIEAWWKAFADHTDQIRSVMTGRGGFDLVDFMHSHLRPIHPQLMWEFGPAVHGKGVRLIITPEAERWLRPLVKTIVKMAPELPGWEFYPHRLAESVDVAAMFVKNRFQIDLHHVQFEAKIGPQGKIDLILDSPEFGAAESAHEFNAALVGVEALIGEEALDRWVGMVDVLSPGEENTLPPEQRPRRMLPIDRFRPTVEALIGSLEAQRPEYACHEWPETEPTYTGFEMQPDPKGAETLRCDIFVGVTWRPDVFQGACRPDHFDSARYSRHGEIFAYVAIDGSNGLEASAFTDRSEIEDALDEMLVADGLGAVLGGGTGLTFSYIELALAQPCKAVKRIGELLSAGNIPQRSWIAFHDSCLAKEWIGVYPHSPPPPLLE